MAARKTTRADVEFVERHRAEMSIRELAAELGLSPTTVQRIAKRTGALPGKIERAAGAASAPVSAPPVAGSELALLQEHAGVLRKLMRTSKDSSVAQISREYRETLAKITALEAADAPQAEEGGDAFDAACSAIA